MLTHRHNPENPHNPLNPSFPYPCHSEQSEESKSLYHPYEFPCPVVSRLRGNDGKAPEGEGYMVSSSSSHVCMLSFCVVYVRSI